jgi:hypothetical protein
MKTLIVAAMLLASTSAYAAQAKPRDFPSIRKWQALDSGCYRGVFPDDDEVDIEITKEAYAKTARGRVCLAANKLEKQLAAKGYCTYGRSGVGRAGKKYFYPGIDSAGTNSHWTRHCYAIDNLPAD